MFHSLTKSSEAAADLGLPQNIANQYTFNVTTKPANMAGQLKSGTTRGAMTKHSTVMTHFRACQMAKRSTAAKACWEAAREVSPLANPAAGSTTDKAP
jgi:hypothetical protein